MLTVVIAFRNRSINVLQCAVRSQLLYSMVAVVDFGSRDQENARRAVTGVGGLCVCCQPPEGQKWNIGLVMNIGVRKLMDEGVSTDWIGFSGAEMVMPLSAGWEVLDFCDEGVPSVVLMRDAPESFGEPTLSSLDYWIDDLVKWHQADPLTSIQMLNRGMGRSNMPLDTFVALGGMYQHEALTETTPMREDVDMYARLNAWQRIHGEKPVALTQNPGFHVWHPPHKEVHEREWELRLKARLKAAEKGNPAIGPADWGVVDFPVFM